MTNAPTVGILSCCAWSASGRTAAAAADSAMNSRLLTLNMELPPWATSQRADHGPGSHAYAPLQRIAHHVCAGNPCTAGFQFSFVSQVVKSVALTMRR